MSCRLFSTLKKTVKQVRVGETAYLSLWYCIHVRITFPRAHVKKMMLFENAAKAWFSLNLSWGDKFFFTCVFRYCSHVLCIVQVIRIIRYCSHALCIVPSVTVQPTRSSYAIQNCFNQMLRTRARFRKQWLNVSACYSLLVLVCYQRDKRETQDKNVSQLQYSSSTPFFFKEMFPREIAHLLHIGIVYMFGLLFRARMWRKWCCWRLLRPDSHWIFYGVSCFSF